MKNFKKLFAIIATMAIVGSTVPTAVLGAAGYSDELEGAYDYAYENGVTTQSSIDTANMYGSLIRSHMAKMMANYAIEVLGQTPDTDATCNFTDIANETEELQEAMVTACQLGLMGQGITAFNPNGVVTRAQFGTVLSRALWGDTYNDGDPYYADHLQALKDAGIMNNISNPNAVEVRGYVMLMLQRADEGVTSEICETEENVLACSLGLDTCPAECEEEEVAKAGTLAVSMESAEGMDVPHSISALPVATYTIEAGDEDVALESLTLEQGGYSEDDTLDGIALYIDGARVSRISNVNLDEETTLNLTNTYTIKAGSSVEVVVKASITSTAAGDKFNLTLNSIDSSAEDVDYDSDLTSDTFTVLSKENATVTVIKGTTEDFTLGTKGSDLFDFQLKNNSTQNVNFSTITLKANDSDFANYYENFELELDGDTVAEGDINGKYLTFNLDDAYLIEDGDTETFTVVADIIGGAAETISFTIENKTDVVAVGEKYDVPAYLTNAADFAMATLNISAGDVSLTKTNPGSTSIIRNRTNLSLGAFTITNNAGGNLTLQDFDLAFTQNTSSATMAQILKNVKVRIGSTTASLRTLEANGTETIWSADDLGKSIGSKLIVYVYADTEDVDMTDTNFTMKLQGLAIEETADEEPVTDITPSTLTYTTMKGGDSELKFTKVSLADKSVAKGAEDVEAVSFKVKTSTTEGAKISKLTFTAPAVNGDWDGDDTDGDGIINVTDDGTEISFADNGTTPNVAPTAETGIVVNSDTVQSAMLYIGDDEYSADIKNGSIVVDEDITLAKNTTTTMTLKVNIESTPTIYGEALKYTLGAVEAKDTSADKNDLSIANAAIAGRNITIQNNATLSANYEASATNNKYAKSILAGTTATVAEYEVYSNYEAANVGEVAVVFNKALIDSVTDVELYYDGELVANNPTWSNSNKTATFEDLDFDIAMAEKLLTVKLITTAIDEDGGAAVKEACINSLTLSDLQGVSSTDAMADKTITVTTKEFDIVPATVITSISDVTATTAKINITVDKGSNTTTDGVGIKVKVTDLVLGLAGNNGGLSTVRVEDEAGATLGTWTTSATTPYALTSETTTFVDTLVSAGTTTWTVYVTQLGTIDNPSYTLSLKGAKFGTSKTASYDEAYSDRATTNKTLISK